MTTFETSRADWLTVAEALRRVLSAAHPLASEVVEVGDALGRALAEPVVAGASLPPWDNSAMDGYAVRGGDVVGATQEAPVRLRVIGEVRAGSPTEGEVERGQAVKIMTGGPLPGGSDSVVRVEDTDAETLEPGWVRVLSDRDRGRHVRPSGQDMRAGDVVLPSGTGMGPGQIAVAAAAGRAAVSVHRRPTVAILSSGDELRTAKRFADVVSGRGVPETNGVTLAAAVRACGAMPLSLGVARDEPEHIRERVARAADSDVLVTTGGASMGEADLFKRVLREDGLTVDFWRVRMRPGTPFSLAHLPRSTGGRGPLPVFGLPGNPASAFVTFQLFVRPFLLSLAGHSHPHLPCIHAVAAERLGSPPGLCHFLRVRLEEADGAPRVRLTGHQGSGLVQSLGLAQGLAVVPEGTEAVEVGEPVRVILLDDGPGRSASPGYLAHSA